MTLMCHVRREDNVIDATTLTSASKAMTERYDQDNQTNYPTIRHNGSPQSPKNRSVDDRNIVPHKQTFAWMTMGIVFAFWHMSNGLWNKGTCTKFLGTMGVATWLQDLVADVKVNKEWDEDKYIPYLWRCGVCDPNKFIETAMHLLGHGIVGTLIEEIKKVMTHHGLWTTFIEFVNPRLGDVAFFRLD